MSHSSPTVDEEALYSRMFAATFGAAKPPTDAVVPVSKVVTFLKKGTGLSDDSLLSLCMKHSVDGVLSRNNFAVVMHTIAETKRSGTRSASPSTDSSSPVKVSITDTTPVNTTEKWPSMTTAELEAYVVTFCDVSSGRGGDDGVSGYVSAKDVKSLFFESKLPVKVLNAIWNMSDVDKDKKLNAKEFCIAMHLMSLVKQSGGRVQDLPAALPESLHPDRWQLHKQTVTNGEQTMVTPSKDINMSTADTPAQLIGSPLRSPSSSLSPIQSLNLAATNAKHNMDSAVDRALSSISPSSSLREKAPSSPSLSRTNDLQLADLRASVTSAEQDIIAVSRRLQQSQDVHEDVLNEKHDLEAKLASLKSKITEKLSEATRLEESTNLIRQRILLIKSEMKSLEHVNDDNDTMIETKTSDLALERQRLNELVVARAIAEETVRGLHAAASRQDVERKMLLQACDITEKDAMKLTQEAETLRKAGRDAENDVKELRKLFKETSQARASVILSRIDAAARLEQANAEHDLTDFLLRGDPVLPDTSRAIKSFEERRIARENVLKTSGIGVRDDGTLALPILSGEVSPARAVPSSRSPSEGVTRPLLSEVVSVSTVPSPSPDRPKQHSSSRNPSNFQRLDDEMNKSPSPSNIGTTAAAVIPLTQNEGVSSARITQSTRPPPSSHASPPSPTNVDTAYMNYITIKSKNQSSSSMTPTTAATHLQSSFRAYRARSDYRRFRRAVVTVQCAVRWRRWRKYMTQVIQQLPSSSVIEKIHNKNHSKNRNDRKDSPMTRVRSPTSLPASVPASVPASAVLPPSPTFTSFESSKESEWTSFQTPDDSSMVPSTMSPPIVTPSIPPSSVIHHPSSIPPSSTITAREQPPSRPHQLRDSAELPSPHVSFSDISLPPNVPIAVFAREAAAPHSSTDGLASFDGNFNFDDATAISFGAPTFDDKTDSDDDSDNSSSADVLVSARKSLPSTTGIVPGSNSQTIDPFSSFETKVISHAVPWTTTFDSVAPQAFYPPRTTTTTTTPSTTTFPSFPSGSFDDAGFAVTEFGGGEDQGFASFHDGFQGTSNDTIVAPIHSSLPPPPSSTTLMSAASTIPIQDPDLDASLALALQLQQEFDDADAIRSPSPHPTTPTSTLRPPTSSALLSVSSPPSAIVRNPMSQTFLSCYIDCICFKSNTRNYQDAFISVTLRGPGGMDSIEPSLNTPPLPGTTARGGAGKGASRMIVQQEVTLTTPLETMMVGSTVFFEFRHRKGDKLSVRCWSFLVVDELKKMAERLAAEGGSTSRVVLQNLVLYKKPTDYSRKKLKVMDKQAFFIVQVTLRRGDGRGR